MNSWLKLALYSLIGIIIGSFALGLLTPDNGVNMNANAGNFRMNMNYQMPMYNDANGFQRGMRGMFDRMPGNMGQGQMNGGQMNNGMGGM